tara:strand:- start:44 stop:940 length:897 start_codon:yes stop_codon:yes gene_type:complete
MSWFNIIKEPYREEAIASAGATIPLQRLPEPIQLALNQVRHKQFKFKEESVSLSAVPKISSILGDLKSPVHNVEHLFNVINWKTGRVKLKWHYYESGSDRTEWMMGNRPQDKHNQRVANLVPPTIPSNTDEDDVLIILNKGGWRSFAGSYSRPARIDIYVDEDSDLFDFIEGKPLVDGVDLTNGEMMALLAVKGAYGSPKYKAFNELNIGEGEFGAENTIFQDLEDGGWVTFNPNHRRTNLRNYPLITQKTRTLYDDFFSYEILSNYDTKKKYNTWVKELKNKPLHAQVKLDYIGGDE